MRILFAGSSEIAVPTLRAIAARFDVGAVLTNEPKPGKRGRTLVPTPVEAAARELGLPVLRFDRLGKAARETVAAYECDTLLCFAYGRIFGPKFLSLFSGEALNIHPSLLPEFRGPTPIQGAILHQKTESGISLQRLDLKMDEGDIMLTKRFSLSGDETAGSLTEHVMDEAALLAVEGLNRIQAGTAVFTPQAGNVTYTPLLTMDHAPLDFSKNARSLHAQIRALNPWPKARCIHEGRSLIISGVWGTVGELGFEVVEPGRVLGIDKEKGIGIGTGLGILWVTTLQLEKRKEMDWRSFINGNRRFIGSRLE
ncbi:MAG TPA: methionyl-tRNA formyltransferase [Sphaerochaeta sp.]|jgi:methionyl-tRNA formyltransferase|nr:methionyl-tRNA formyltransferase [Spirochaetales bacterium]HPX28650.1 methionyl-tRNA formyltransferase [Sphaerochaeta sp.]HQB54059.1 methionyl-tRNA formyltransferase [Sphaerochaeta sp.]